MNFLQMAKRLHSESANSTAAPASVASTNPRHVRYFNLLADAWRELQLERDWRWMRSTLDATLTVDQQAYSGAALGAVGFRRWRKNDSTYSPYAYRDGSPNSLWPLEYWNLDDFRHLWVYRQLASSTPVAWTFDEQNNLLVGPKPSQAFKLRKEYWTAPTELVNDGDSPNMPDEFHMIVVWTALQDIAITDSAKEILVKATQRRASLYDELLIDQARLPHL